MIPRNSPSIRSFHKGKRIFSEGQESKIAYLVKSGTVDLFRVVDRKKTVLNTLRRGDIFGEMALLTDQRRTVCAEASSFCELVVLTEELMSKLLERSPGTVRKMVELLAARVVATDDKAGCCEDNNSFLSLATILDLAYREHLIVSKERQRRVRNCKTDLSVRDFTATVKSLVMFSSLEVESFLETVFKLKLIELKGTKKGKDSFAEKYISIADIDSFLPCLRNLYKQMKSIGASLGTHMSYMSFSDLADKTGTTPELIYKKVVKEELPENLLFFNRDKALEWSKGKDESFFKKFKLPRKNLNDLETADDFIFVDNPTLMKCLNKLDFNKIMILYSAADEQNRNKLKRNLGRKLATILENDPPAERELTDIIVVECCDELFDCVRKIKGSV